jgi:hypothetical protein
MALEMLFCARIKLASLSAPGRVLHSEGAVDDRTFCSATGPPSYSIATFSKTVSFQKKAVKFLLHVLYILASHDRERGYVAWANGKHHRVQVRTEGR